MSIASSPDHFLRPEDQALKVLFPSIEDSNPLDEFFNEVFYDLEGESDNKGPVGSPDDNLIRNTDINEYPRLPSLPGSTVQSPSPVQPWRKGLWCLNQQPTTTNNIVVERTRRPGVDPSSSAHLLSNENFAVRYHRSPLTSPPAKGTKAFGFSPTTPAYRHKGSTRLPQSREATLSPSPMYARPRTQAKMEQIEPWQQDFQNFNLRASLNGSSQQARGPPRGQYAHTARHINAAVANQNATIGLAISTYEPVARQVLGSDDSAVVDPSLVEHSNRYHMEQPSNPHHPTSAVQQHSFEQLLTPVWTTESLHSSNSSHQSYDTMPQSVQSTQSGQSPHDLYQHQMQSWWSPPNQGSHEQWATRHATQPSNITAPIPQRNSAQLLVQNFDQEHEGLGIKYPKLEQINQAVFQESNAYYHDISPGTAVAYYQTTNGHHSRSDLPMPSPYAFTNASPFTTPRTVRRSQSRTPSPSISPTNATPRTVRQRSPTKSGHEYNHHRRKSIHKSGPIKGSHEPLPQISTTGRSRSRSTSKAPRTPRTPKTPTGGFGSLDFVNFTPRDSVKLLSDVAPSGSSKTRARRDAEARDKRKKLGEAALKAVSSAGGDVEALKKVILV